jgi:leader peptidase (prepilin peptidase) / N-methyltransferase
MRKPQSVNHATRQTAALVESLAVLCHIPNVVIFFFFLFGIVIGSFLNVCISRIPEGLSIVAPGSRCPRCLTPIKAYDNVPILGWLWLRGKCRSCALPISPMYPIIELLTGLLFVACYLSFDITQVTFKWIFFCCLMVILAVTDLRVRMLPDAINWPGFGVGLGISIFIPPEDGTALLLSLRIAHQIPPRPVLGLLDALLGAAFGSLLLLGASALYKAVRGREGMGLGDVKMMALVGAFLGLRGAFITILLGTLLGSAVGLALIAGLYLVRYKREVAERAARRGLGKPGALRWAIVSKYQLPLGTFLAVGALLVVFFAQYPAFQLMPRAR